VEASGAVERIHGQAEYRVRFDWGPDGARISGTGASVIVVVDVLSFSTAIEVGTSRGARIVPFSWRDERASEFGTRIGALVAVSRHEMTPSSPFSLSPPSLATLEFGQTLVLPSPNGAEVTLAAASTGATVLAGCLRNAAAVAEVAAEIGGPIAVIAAGERWYDGGLRPALEDLIGAGRILGSLAGRGQSPEASAAIAVASALNAVTALSDCVSGRELTTAGFEQDVVMAGGIDVSRTVPILNGDSYEAWQARPSSRPLRS
jgi:2-phosphosulfolactate phosphatase